MSRGNVFRSFLLNLRERLFPTNRHGRKLRRLSELKPGYHVEGLEDRVTPATFFWTGFGAPISLINGVEVQGVDLDGNGPGPFIPGIGIDGMPASTLWSDPRNWLNGNVPTQLAVGQGHDLVFDQQYVRDFDVTAGVTGDLADSDTANYGSFEGFNDILTSVRSITIVSSTGGGTWEFFLGMAGPVTEVNIEDQAGIRTFGTFDAPSTNVVAMNLRNGNGTAGFNITTGATSPLVVIGNINLTDSVTGTEGGLLNAVVGNTSLSADLEIRGTISGTGIGDGSRVFKDGPGGMLLSRPNSYNGLTTVNQGDMFVGGTGTLGNTDGDTLVNPGAVLHLGAGVNNFDRVTLNAARLGGSNNAIQTGDILLLDDSFIGVDDTSTIRVQFTIAGRISDANFTINDVTYQTGSDIDSVIILTNPLNDYGGATIIGGLDSLRLQPTNNVGDVLPNTGVIPNGSAVTILAGAELDMNSAGVDLTEIIGSLSGDGDIVLGTSRLVLGGNNTSTTYNGRISSAIVTSGLQGGITKEGTGIFTMTGRNTYTGQTLINRGTLRIGSGIGVIDDFNRVTVGFLSTFDLNNFSETVGSVETPMGGSSAHITLGAGTLTTGGNNLTTTFDGVISGSGGLTKRGSGVFTLTGANTYTGATAIKGGTLRLDNLPERLSDVTAVTVDPGAIFDLNSKSETIGSLAGGFLGDGTGASQRGNVLLGSASLNTGGNNQSTTFAGIISGTGGVVKLGSGTFTLLNANTYTGPTNVLGGSLVVGDSTSGVAVGSITSSVLMTANTTLRGDGVITGDVNVQPTATLSPFNPSTPNPLNIVGNLALSQDSNFVVLIEDQTRYSRLDVTGAVDLGGATLSISFLGTYVHIDDAIFSLIANDSTDAIGNQFAGLPTNGVVTLGGNQFFLSYTGGSNNNDVTLTAIINNAPVLTPGTAAIGTVDEDATNPPGILISSFASAFISDPDDPLAERGIAVVGFTGTGTWQYSLDGGSTWQDFGITAPNSARVLRTTDLVRFLPGANFTGSASITYNAWDQSDGLAPGSIVNLTLPNSTGGTSAYSISSRTGTVAVAAVNDAPVIQVPAGNLFFTIPGPSALSGISFSDTDAGLGLMTVTLAVNNGVVNVNTTVSGGVTAGQVTGNGTASVTILADLGAINTTFGATNGVTYTVTPGNVSDTLTITIDDNGNTGTGGPLSALVMKSLVRRRIDDVVGRLASNGQWWAGVSDGTSFTNQLYGNWSTSVTWVDVQVGDFDGDGLEDDIVGRALQTGEWWVGISNGVTMTNVKFGQWSPQVTWVDVRLGDFDGDGLKDDVVGRVAATGQWFLSTTTGGVFSTNAWGQWSNLVTWVDVRAADFDNDGKTDVAGRAAQNGQWWVARSNSANSSTNFFYGVWSTQVTWLDVSVGDWDGDGIENDLVGRVAGSNQWWAANSNEQNTFGMRLLGSWAAGANFIDVRVGDFDGNGIRNDIAGRNASTGEWSVSRATGSSGQTSFDLRIFGTWATNMTFLDVRVGDFDGDGLQDDIAGRSQQTGEWFVAISNGSSFTNTLFGQWATVTWLDTKAGEFVS